MQHVFTVLFCVLPQLSASILPPECVCVLYMLELSLKRLAILLDCAVVLKQTTRRIAPVCIGVALLVLLPLWQPLPAALPLCVQAEIYAHMLSTLFALLVVCGMGEGEAGHRQVCSHFGVGC